MYRKVVFEGRPHLHLVVPKEVRCTILSEAFTYGRIEGRYFYSEGLKSVARYVSSYDLFQHKNSPIPRLVGFLQPLRVSEPFLQAVWNYGVPFTPVRSMINIYCSRSGAKLSISSNQQSFEVLPVFLWFDDDSMRSKRPVFCSK